MAAVSANKLELLQIADAVAREKSIDRGIVIAAMEDAIAKAARARYGSETDVHAEIDAEKGELRLSRHMLVVDQVENSSNQISLEDAPPRQSRRADRRHYRRHPAAAGIWPHRRAIRQAGDRAEGARGRARPPVPGIQGSHRRYRQRHRQARRVWQRHCRSRPRRGHHSPRRDAAARGIPQWRPRPRLYFRRAARNQGSADFPVAHSPAIHGKAVRAGGAGNLRRHRRDQGGGPRSRFARENRRNFAGFIGRPGRRLRRHARLARAGRGQRTAGRKDRHHPVVAGHRDLCRQRAGARRGRQGRDRRGSRADRGRGAGHQ